LSHLKSKEKENANFTRLSLENCITMQFIYVDSHAILMDSNGLTWIDLD